MNHREVAKRVLRIATGAEPTEDQVDRLVDARGHGLRIKFVTVREAPAKAAAEPDGDQVFKPGDVVECIDDNVLQPGLLSAGQTYKVLKAHCLGELVCLVGSKLGPNYSFASRRFRLVSSPTSSATS